MRRMPPGRGASAPVGGAVVGAASTCAIGLDVVADVFAPDVEPDFFAAVVAEPTLAVVDVVESPAANVVEVDPSPTSDTAVVDVDGDVDSVAFFADPLPHAAATRPIHNSRHPNIKRR